MQDLDDIALLRAYAADGSEEAFATLVARHINRVYSVALRHTGNSHQAEEITQVVFVILARKSSRLKTGIVLEGWLYQTARLTSLAFLRGEARRTHREQESFMQTGLNENEPDVWRQIAPLLDSAMASLNETDRHALVLRFFYGKTLCEVGAALGGSEGAATLRVRRALEKLRQYFARRGAISTTDALGSMISSHGVQAAPAALAKSIAALAAAKGIAAGGSTSTLINGALKIMAWTKAKTAIVVGAAAFLAIGTSTIIVCAPGPDISGTWEGTVTDKKGLGVHAGDSPKIRIVLKISRSNGNYQVSGDDIDQGEHLPITKVVYRFHTLHLDFPDGSYYAGSVNFTGTKISGGVKGKDPVPLTFKRIANPPPFPEPLKDEEFATRPDSQIQGYWTGTIGSGKGALQVFIKIAEAADGSYRADFYSQSLRAERQPTGISYDGTTVKLMPTAGYGMFEGELRNGDTELAGDWIQGGRHTPTTLARTKWVKP